MTATFLSLPRLRGRSALPSIARQRQVGACGATAAVRWVGDARPHRRRRCLSAATSPEAGGRKWRRASPDTAHRHARGGGAGRGGGDILAGGTDMMPQASRQSAAGRHLAQSPIAGLADIASGQGDRSARGDGHRRLYRAGCASTRRCCSKLPSVASGQIRKCDDGGKSARARGRRHDPAAAGLEAEVDSSAEAGRSSPAGACRSPIFHRAGARYPRRRDSRRPLFPLRRRFLGGFRSRPRPARDRDGGGRGRAVSEEAAQRVRLPMHRWADPMRGAGQKRRSKASGSCRDH